MGLSPTSIPLNFEYYLDLSIIWITIWIQQTHLYFPIYVDILVYYWLELPEKSLEDVSWSNLDPIKFSVIWITIWIQKTLDFLIYLL